MKMYQILWIIVAVILLQLPTLSVASEEKKEGEIKGIVKEHATELEMAYANIAFYSSIDSSLIGGTITGDDGSFVLKGLSEGNFYVEFNFIGFDKKVVENVELGKTTRKVDLGVIYLEPASELLDDVEVVAEKSKISYQIDKKVISVDKELSAIGGTAITVLENAPSMKVDVDGNLQMRGSSDFTVLINGKPSLLKGNDALKQIPSSGIEKIEIITNPSARFDPDGKAGILNVILKKDGMKGLNGFMNGVVGTGDKYSGNAMANYKVGKFNIFMGLDFSDNVYSQDMEFERILTVNPSAGHIASTGVIKNMHSALIYKAGIDYSINDHNELSVSGNFGERRYDSSNNSSFVNGGSDVSMTTYGQTNNYMDVFGDVWEIYGRYQHQFGDNHEFTLSGQYESWDGYDHEDLEEQRTNSDFSIPLGYDEKHRYQKLDQNNQFILKGDYVRKINDQSGLELGYQYRTNDRDEQFTFEDFIDGEFVSNEQLKNELNYSRDIHSIYATYSNVILGTQFKIGLRAESTSRKIDISNVAEGYEYEKQDFFPSVHLSRQLSSTQQLQVSYSRRVRRPNSWILNNNPRWMDSKNVFFGDPMLKPEYADSYEISYQKSFSTFSLNTQLYYRQTNDAFGVVRYLADENNDIVYHKQTNANKSKAMGLELGTNFHLTQWWKLNVSGNFYKYDIEGEGNENASQKENTTWDSRIASTFILKNNLRLQLDGSYSAKSVDLSGERGALFSTNVSASKELGPFTVGLNIRDFLSTMRFKYKTETDFERTSYNVTPESPTFMFSASYRFNNFKHTKRRLDGEGDYRGGGF